MLEGDVIVFMWEVWPVGVVRGHEEDVGDLRIEYGYRWEERVLTAGRCFWNKVLICISACARPSAVDEVRRSALSSMAQI